MLWHVCIENAALFSHFSTEDWKVMLDVFIWDCQEVELDAYFAKWWICLAQAGIKFTKKEMFFLGMPCFFLDMPKTLDSIGLLFFKGVERKSAGLFHDMCVSLQSHWKENDLRKIEILVMSSLPYWRSSRQSIFSMLRGLFSQPVYANASFSHLLYQSENVLRVSYSSVVGEGVLLMWRAWLSENKLASEDLDRMCEMVLEQEFSSNEVLQFLEDLALQIHWNDMSVDAKGMVCQIFKKYMDMLPVDPYWEGVRCVYQIFSSFVYLGSPHQLLQKYSPIPLDLYAKMMVSFMNSRFCSYEKLCKEEAFFRKIFPNSSLLAKEKSLILFYYQNLFESSLVEEENITSFLSLQDREWSYLLFLSLAKSERMVSPSVGAQILYAFEKKNYEQEKNLAFYEEMLAKLDPRAQVEVEEKISFLRSSLRKG